MRKLFYFGMCILLLFSCKQRQNVEQLADTSAVEINVEKLPKRSNLNAKSRAILKDWPEFNALEISFDALYKVENNEDLILVIEDLIEKQKLLAESEYPEAFDKPQIKSRQKVLKTYILKVKAALEYRIDAVQPTIEMVEAYNAQRNQFNVIVNNTLDTKLIFDE